MCSANFFASASASAASSPRETAMLSQTYACKRFFDAPSQQAYLRPRKSSCSAAMRYQRISASCPGAPAASEYIKPSRNCASACPCPVAIRCQRAAAAQSRGTYSCRSQAYLKLSSGCAKAAPPAQRPCETNSRLLHRLPARFFFRHPRSRT